MRNKGRDEDKKWEEGMDDKKKDKIVVDPRGLTFLCRNFQYFTNYIMNMLLNQAEWVGWWEYWFLDTSNYCKQLLLYLIIFSCK